MKASMEISRLRATNKQNETGTSPATTVSTDALRVGLAHLIHEINNPLQFVHNAVSLMEMNMSAANGCRDPLTVEAMERGKNAIEHLTSLIHSLRSQLEILWQVNPAFEVLNLSTIIDEIIQGEAMRFEANGISFAKDIVDTLPLIQGNKNLLEVAIRNLFKNASDAMPEGGQLSVKTGVCDRSVYLEISDSGPGIPPEIDVFQPFVTSKRGGMGLGLAIARHIVEVHGGTITHRNQASGGTTFCINFSPRVDAKNISLLRKPVKYAHAEELFGCLCHTPYK